MLTVRSLIYQLNHQKNLLRSHSIASWFSASWFSASWFSVSWFSVSCFAAITSVSCLPLDDAEPECFPDEGCARGKQCLAGRCVTPPSRVLTVDLSCLGGVGCGDSLTAAEVREACLIIEQPHNLIAGPLALDRARLDGGAEVSLPVMSGPIRASVLLFDDSARSALEARDAMSVSADSVCALSDAELERYQLHRACADSLGCVLRLRAEEIEVSDELSIALSFSAGSGSGQCAERSFSAEEPEELCGGDDVDCDGFVDEGTRCE